jgi:ketosteroid isomerase-like protein
MDECNVEILRNFYEALNRGDLNAALELCERDASLYAPTMVAAGRFRDSDNRAAWYLERWFRDWDKYQPEPQEFIGAGDQVAVFVHLRGKLIYENEENVNRVAIEEEVADIFTMRDGKITRLRFYLEREKALEAIAESA